jgi:hypothetical protein
MHFPTRLDIPLLFTGSYILLGRFASSTGFNIPIPFGCSFFLFSVSFIFRLRCTSLQLLNEPPTQVHIQISHITRTDTFKRMHCDQAALSYRAIWCSGRTSVLYSENIISWALWCARAVEGMNCLRPLKHWDRGFEFYFRHGCLCTFILRLCSPACAGSGLATGWPPVQGVLPTVNDQETWERPRSNKGM